MKLKTVKKKLRREIKFIAFYEAAVERSFFYEIGNVADLVDILIKIILIEALCDET